MLPQVLKYIPVGNGAETSVVELYSGVCAIGLNSALRSDDVLCCDVNSFVERDGFNSARLLLPKVTF